MSAWVLAFVPEALYIEHQERYQEVVSAGLTKIVRVPSESKLNRRVLLFFLNEAFFTKGVLVHVLRTDPSPVIRLKQWPIVGKKIRYVLEYEGDMPSECVYQSAYVESPRPPVEPPLELRPVYDNLLHSQQNHVRQADGVVLMSQEHVELWESRLKNQLKACLLPTLADPKRIYFDEHKRSEIRTQLGLSDRIVLVYAGNVICKWQRLDAMCRFIARLAEQIPNVWFLALVRLDDLQLAKAAISRHGLEQRSTIKHVTADVVADYLSSADLAIFLRHIHPMNLVVTSGKLGEYLAAGLPVITTGANAAIINKFIRESQAGLFIDDSLPINESIIAELDALLDRSQKPGWRVELSLKTAECFGGENDPFRTYAPFIRKIAEQG
ncbi:glycosyltransferase [Lyngbya confervoides]|uniref:Glycosyltransferase n=1 Tax=Lyngbya confervoides BDU141951 TaxID=1574623 RepID=A0ABD4T3L0_9CYAN|nr:glycosyltransferase [Lyngbya confervoides]MCM1983006.1 glycosyltransferase [Lyngbya confervoides BDU141951]